MRRWVQSVSFAWAGVAAMLRSQPNARVELAIAAGVVVAGAVARVPPRDWAVLVAMMGLVLAMEAMNTALESAMDRVSPESHPLTKLAKDAAAAAVLIAAASSVVVGLLILAPPLWARLVASG